MRWAMEVGIESVEHANLLEAEDLEYFEKYGTVLSDPNLQLFSMMRLASRPLRPGSSIGGAQKS